MTTTADMTGGVDTDRLRRILLKDEITEFFEREYDLLDQRDLTSWLDVFAADATYTVPLQRNVKFGEWDRLSGLAPLDTAWFSDDKETLISRVEQLETGVHWCEEPISRSSHMITNVRILTCELNDDRVESVSTRSRILVYRNRVEREVDLFVGIREDCLRRRAATWEVVNRLVFLEQNVLLSKNLTLFF